MPVTRSALSIVAIIPVGALDGAKSRLGAVLDAEERLGVVVARRVVVAVGLDRHVGHHQPADGRDQPGQDEVAGALE